MVRTRSGRGTTDEENQENSSQEISESEEDFHSNLEGSTDEEAASALASSLHPFYEGHQYPPQPPLDPPDQVELPPLPPLPDTESGSTSDMADQHQPQQPLPPPPGPPPPQGQPGPAPMMKERGLKPDPFTKKSDYEKFHRGLGLYFRANEAIYPEDVDKIYFTLTLMTEGTPGQWAQNFIEKVDAQTVNGAIPQAAWGTWEEFRQALKKSFADPNKDKNAYNELEMLEYPPGRSADEFFQEFETLAGHAGYMGANPNHVYLINLIKQKLPHYLINHVYSKDVPITYEAYRDKVIKYDNLNKKL